MITRVGMVWWPEVELGVARILLASKQAFIEVVTKMAK